MKTDVIVTWPDNCDYPLWRLFIRENRKRFNQVIISMMRTNAPPFYDRDVALMMQSDDVIILEPPPAFAGDWRNEAVNRALNLSIADWVWFTEQDFIPTNNTYFDDVILLSKRFNAIGTADGPRIHPCSLFVTRSAIEQTKKDFSARPDKGYDHFGRFTRDLMANKIHIATIDDNFTHMAGLSSNWYLVSAGKEPNYKPEEFYQYLEACLQAPIELDKNFVRIARDTLQRAKANYRE